MERFSKLVTEAMWERPSGAFYFFPDMRPYCGRRTPEGQLINTDEELALYLIEDANVVTVPGSKFQRPGHLRFAYAVSIETINTGIERLAQALNRLRF